MGWKLLEPILIGSNRAKNRIVMAPMETRMSTISGDITQGMINYYTERAKGGAGVVIIENTFIDNLASRSSLSSSGLYSDHLIAGKNLLAEALKPTPPPWDFCKYFPDIQKLCAHFFPVLS